MSAVHIHLLSVHLPVAGVLFALGLLALAQILKRTLLLQVAYGTVLLSAAFAAAAYYSGPTAAEQLKSTLTADQAWVDQHAQIGRAFFFVVVVTAVLALQAMVQFAQGDSPPRWLRGLIALLLVGCTYLAMWSAHLGGAIRHVEIRQPEWWLFPHLEAQGPDEAESSPGGD